MSQRDPVDLQPRELLQIAADFFEARGIAYCVVGAMAGIPYGENRFTNDVDFVADLRPEHVDDLCVSFPAPDYYVARHVVDLAQRKLEGNTAFLEELDRRGRERALVYKVAVLTGLRRGEIESLTLGHLHLDETTPALRMQPQDTKNR